MCDIAGVRENFVAQTNQWFYFDVVLANMAFLFRISDCGFFQSKTLAKAIRIPKSEIKTVFHT